MEKYSQFRDRGSGIAPFFPIPTQSSGIYLPFHLFLLLIRLPILLTATLSYFFVLQWLPIGSLGKKASLWLILGAPGVWWIDLQIDGVKKGSLAKHHEARLPQPGSIIACSYTSPLDSLYLAAIFDPVFTASYPSTRLVHRISLFHAMFRAFQYPGLEPPKNEKLTDLQTLIKQYPGQAIVVYPECTTTNGRGILPFSPSLLTAPPEAKIFPISLRYTAGDITTPVPGSYVSFVWNLLSKPTHCIRVRIAESAHNTSQSPATRNSTSQTEREMLYDDRASSSDTLLNSEDAESMNAAEKRVLDKVAEALARLGRVKRVGLGLKDKDEFVKVWTKQRR
ncbi:hypothetical protein HO173_011620 [Letharia columbiana]|uniref:Phospholipid/glycerol acyltransferase domain-containing protein n=1 Tax=Letharia columbiana TaxID=112416 RepID=A0A8H6CSJ4_9LECA|nr:uncharacterized protein HO173_011620 [Letharia columbiana]KAF6228773.1 hypothetical protein HO173_011620 [Letharia columbiana]